MQENAKKTRQKRDAKQRIILTLGREGRPLKPHTIAEMTGLSDAGVQTAIKGHSGLVLTGMLRPFSEPKPWKAGGKTVEYVLTFRGIIEYLNLRDEPVDIGVLMKEEEWKRIKDARTADIRKFIQKYSEFCDYVLFKEHGALREWLGDETYAFFATAARKMKWGNLPYRVTVMRQALLGMERAAVLDNLDEIKSALNEVRRKGKKITLTEQITALESQRGEIRRRIQAINEKAEKLWVHTFSLTLFELIFRHVKGKIKRIENESLHKHIKETLEQERKDCAWRVKNIREMKATFEKVFSPRLKIRPKPARSKSQR